MSRKIVQATPPVLRDKDNMRFFLIIFLCCFASFAQARCDGASFFDRLSAEDLAALDTLSAQTPFGTGLLWDAIRGDQHILIVGTMHIFDPRLAPIMERIRSDVAEADVVMVEATPEEEAKMQAAFAAEPEIIFITEGPTLPEQLDEDLWTSIAEAARARSIPAFMASKMQPWYLALSLGIPPCAIESLTSGIRGLDHMIMDQAARSDVPLVALEPFHTLLDIMREGSFEEQVEMLQLTMLTPDLHSEMFVAMLDAYFAEDIARVWEASRLASKFVPGLDPALAQEQFAKTEQVLLIRRNQAWMPVIEDNADKKSVVAVGAAHLIGEEGILRLLERDGWTVTAR